VPGWRKGSRVRRWLGLGGGVSLASAILSLGTHLSLSYDPWGGRGLLEPDLVQWSPLRRRPLVHDCLGLNGVKLRGAGACRWSSLPLLPGLAGRGAGSPGVGGGGGDLSPPHSPCCVCGGWTYCIVLPTTVHLGKLKIVHVAGRSNIYLFTVFFIFTFC